MQACACKFTLLSPFRKPVRASFSVVTPIPIDHVSAPLPEAEPVRLLIFERTNLRSAGGTRRQCMRMKGIRGNKALGRRRPAVPYFTAVVRRALLKQLLTVGEVTWLLKMQALLLIRSEFGG